jgi:type II secretory ATPase GspE/PulE/Tfp pilus assembly ATPase PilB-like protein
MRIPSSLNDSSLYRRRRSRHESVQEYRRLLRLFIGLVLVTGPRGSRKLG